MTMEMHAPSSLVVRPHPFVSESFNGFRIRVAEANRFKSSYEVPEPWTNQDSDVKTGPLDVLLRRPAGFSARKWPALPNPAKQEAEVLLGKAAVARSDIRPASTHICPDCVTEDGHCSYLWELRYWTACPRHDRLMLTHCPSCNRFLSPRRTRLLECGACNQDLADSRFKEQAPAVCVQLARLLQCAAETGTVADTKGRFGPLFDAGLREGLRALRILAGFIYGAKRKWLLVTQENAANRAAHFAEVLSLFERWPVSWWEMLAQRVEGAILTRDHGLRSLFRREINGLDRDAQAPGVLFEAFVAWLEMAFPAIHKTRAFSSLFAEAESQSDWLTVQEARQRLGLSYRAVTKLADSGKVERCYRRIGNHRRQFISRESVERYTETASRTLPLRRAAAHLGVSRVTASRLVDAGLLPLVDATNRHARVVSLDDVDRLFDRIEEATKRRWAGKSLGISAALALASQCWGGMDDLVRAVVERGLPVCGFDRKKGLRSLRVPKRHLCGLLNDTPRDDVSGWLTLHDAAMLLGEKIATAKQLIAIGALQIVYQERKRNAFIKSDEVRRFKNAYVTDKELSKSFDLPLWRIKKRFAWAQFEWAKFNGGYLRGFYEREAAEEFVRTRILPYEKERTFTDNAAKASLAVRL